eukprot:scaffold129981_cov33-Tisochrysis_lutea.AAC.1
MAGCSGARSFIFSPLKKIEAICPMDLALLIWISFLRTARVYLMGASEKVSTPPASTTSACPARICAAPVQMAWLDEMHACVTVCAGTLCGTPAENAASRATLEVLGS